VRGSRTLRGYVSGDPLEPIVPTSRDPVTFELEATFEDFSLWSDPEINRLTVKTGGLSGRVSPRLAIDTETGACSIATPVAELGDIQWKDAELIVESEGKRFDVSVPSSELAAVNGTRDGVTNRISGTIAVDGETITVDGPLDPDFDQGRFDASYACLEHMRVPAVESECNMKKTLGEGAARLLVLALGNLGSLANSDEDCGFSARRVLTNPSQVVGDVGDPGMMRWDIGSCTLAPNANSPVKTDCLGRETYAGGAATFAGSRTVTGLRDEVVIIIIIRFDSIIPTARDSVLLEFANIDFQDFWVAEEEPGAAEPGRGLRLRSGSMSASVQPILGERASEPGTFDVPTPIAALSTIRVENADARILFNGKRFNVRIDRAELEAFNGSWVDAPHMNYIAGRIVIDGEELAIAPSALDEEYQQVEFDDRYACTDDLRGLVPPAASP
jgi:hypothetical protein